MKQLFTIIFFTLFSFIGSAKSLVPHSVDSIPVVDSIPIDVYVLNPTQCPYSLIPTWTNPILDSLGMGPGQCFFLSVDSLPGQELWHYLVPDTLNQTQLNVCLITAPPCNCPPICTGLQTAYPGLAVTLLVCQNVGYVDIEDIDPNRIVKIFDLLGRESQLVPNTFLIVYFDDGSVSKVFIAD